ncbi:MAG: peptidase M10 [Chitinophagaceae bacterium]|nr:peptidase M10 [Chitinophagaceae bacterium]
MGTLELINDLLVLRSHIITYGRVSSPEITARIRDEIESMWNEPAARVMIHDQYYELRFSITAEWKPGIEDLEIISNTDPLNNYFRIETFARDNISFVDGIGCNSGYFKLENLYQGSTTAAHEFGHSLGAEHPEDLDLRGKGIPGIMYPRGTLVDPEFQYEPNAIPGAKGGTMNPIHRRVRQEDVDALRLHGLTWKDNKAIAGEFTNVWHDDHAS